MAFS
ncbi:hypothetical protein D038_0042A, partial [Vibrio parahaemolyticus IDH02189]|jgi:hypothetical protein